MGEVLLIAKWYRRRTKLFVLHTDTNKILNSEPKTVGK